MFEEFQKIRPHSESKGKKPQPSHHDDMKSRYMRLLRMESSKRDLAVLNVTPKVDRSFL